MTDLVERIRAALDAEAELVEYSIAAGIEAYRADGGLVVTRGDLLEDDADGEPSPYARRLRMVAAHRKILDLHAPTFRSVEWFDTDRQDGCGWVCSSCRPENPTEDWHPPVGMAGIRPEGFVARYTLAPCPHLLALAEAYGVEA